MTKEQLKEKHLDIACEQHTIGSLTSHSYNLSIEFTEQVLC